MDATLPDVELQQLLQRFATQFADRITQATETLERSPDQEVRDQALRKALLYVSSAMEIASGPFPEVNLLDMIVFVRLCHSVLDHHWIPQLYREEGADLADAFTRAEQELSEIAAQSLTTEQRDQLGALVDRWLADNPAQLRVEGVRLADFAATAGSAAAERSAQARGLLSSVKTATRAASQALLLTERGLFLFHRLPFLWRLQARLGAREMLGDALAQLLEGPEAPIAKARGRIRHLALRGALLFGLLGGAGLLLRRLRSSTRG